MLREEHAEPTQCPDFVSIGLQNHEESYLSCSFEIKELHVDLLWKLCNFHPETKIKAINMAYYS